MKAVKAIAAVVLAIMLLAAEGLLMGLFSVDKALSEESIKENLIDTDIVGQLVNEVLAANTVNMGGKYGEITQAVLHTEPMNIFFTDYLTSAINTEVYGEPYEEVAYDELMFAFSQGVDEVNASGKYEITDMEAELLKQAMQAAAPDLTAQINAQVGNYEALSGQVTESATAPDETIQRLMGGGFRAVVIIACAMLCGGLIALCWKSRLGFLWCGIVTAAASLLYAALSRIGAAAALAAIDISASEEMVLSMMAGGFEKVSGAGAGIALLFITGFAILKIIDRRTENEET